MTEPCVSHQIYDLLVCAAVLAGFGLYALVQSVQFLRRATKLINLARIGHMLLAACDDDEPAAMKAIESTRALTEELKRAIKWPSRKP